MILVLLLIFLKDEGLQACEQRPRQTHPGPVESKPRCLVHRERLWTGLDACTLSGLGSIFTAA